MRETKFLNTMVNSLLENSSSDEIQKEKFLKFLSQFLPEYQEISEIIDEFSLSNFLLTNQDFS